MSHIIYHQGNENIQFSRSAVENLLSAGDFFWLDIEAPDSTDLEILRNVFGFHPLAVEDSDHFGQRAKIDHYTDFVFLVVYGASRDEDRLVEVHCFYSERFLVTVRRDDCPAFADVRRRYTQQEEVDRPALLLYRIVDGLVDSFFPILDDFDDRIDELEDGVLLQGDDAQLQEIFRMKRLLVGMRKAISPQRDLFSRIVAGLARVPGIAPDDEHYFRDVYDHLIRISDMIDSYRDLLTGAMEVHLSTVSNRLNEVMKQLAIISTVFLPLTFITGFFGQNFAYMVRDIIHSQAAFFVFGLGLELAAVAFFIVLFKRRRWI